MEQKNRSTPLKLRSLSSCFDLLLINVCNFSKKNQLVAGENVERRQKLKKTSKIFVFKSNFLYDGTEDRPHNLDF